MLLLCQWCCVMSVSFFFFFCFSCSAFSIIPFSAMFGNSPCQVGQILDMSYIDIEL